MARCIYHGGNMVSSDREIQLVLVGKNVKWPLEQIIPEKCERAKQLANLIFVFFQRKQKFCYMQVPGTEIKWKCYRTPCTRYMGHIMISLLCPVLSLSLRYILKHTVLPTHIIGHNITGLYISQHFLGDRSPGEKKNDLQCIQITLPPCWIYVPTTGIETCRLDPLVSGSCAVQKGNAVNGRPYLWILL